MNNAERIKVECVPLISPWKGPETIYLGHRQWGFSAALPQPVTITCPPPSGKPGKPTSYSLLLPTRPSRNSEDLHCPD